MNLMSKQNTVPDEAKKDVNERDQHHESEFPNFINKIIKDICVYFQCAPFPRLQMGKVDWVLSFDP